MLKFAIVYLLNFLVILNVIFCARLNTPRVLLPPNYGGTKSNFTLVVSEFEDGGCYKWSSSRPDIVSVTPIDEPCSSKAVVSSVHAAKLPQISIITAEDHSNHVILRCDVVVDAINSLEFLTTSRQLFLGDAPTVIEVMGKNNQGDTFSTLNGIVFEWTLETEEEKNTLRFLKFSDSTYEVPKFIKDIEENGLQGSMILVESFKTGTSKVRVRLREPAFMDVKPADITLIVAANVVLNPAEDVYLFRNSKIQYKVNLIRDGRASEIPLPSDEYYLEVADPDIAKLDVDTSIVTAKKLGHTSITLKDKNAKETEPKPQLTAGIHVIEPSYMLFHVTPGDNWALQELTVYEISLRIYDDRHHKIYPSDNLRIDVHFHTKYFKVNYQSPNGTYFIVKTLLPGPTKIWAEIKGMEVDERIIKMHTNTKVTQDVIIHQFLQVEPSVILMPFDPVQLSTYSLKFHAKGATGVYHWKSENTSLATVSYNPEEASKDAVVKTYGQGDVTISVRDAHNSVFRTSSFISIQPVADLEILPTIVEAELNNEVVIPLALYGYEDLEKKKRKIFDSCSDIPITVEVVEKSRVQYNPDAKFPAVGDGCRSLAFKCLYVGYSRIFVQYDVGDLHLKTTAVIACHKPLNPVFPARMMLLPLGATAEVVFEGGPRPWPLFKDGHFINLQELETSYSSNYIIKDPVRYNKDLHVFKVICTELGETTLEITVGNKKSPTNPNPAVLKSDIQLGCGVPESIYLKPVIKGPDGKKLPCPVGDDSMKIPIQNYDKFDIDIWAKDSKGRKFANLTSLEIFWELSDPSLGKFDADKDVIVNFNGAHGFKRVNRNYRVFHPSGREGTLKITARVVGFRSEILNKAGITSIPPPFDEPIVKSVFIELVNDATITPGKATVFNHASNKVALNVSNGSGYFDVEISDESKADIEYLAETRQIMVTPKEEGSVTITVHDLCLESQQVATADVQISGVEAVIVKMVDKVELNRSIVAVVQVLGFDKLPLAASLYPLLNLRPVVSSPIITTKLQRTPQANDLQALYTITGSSLGQTTIKFKIDSTLDESGTKHEIYRGKPVSSDPLPFQVFSPLRLSPRNITLVVGASFQVICSGGPELLSSIHYSIQDDSIAEVSSSGILTASKLGKTVITARSIDVEKISGKQVVYSQDQATIFVVPLHGIKIHAPLKRLQTGTEMPLFAMGLNNEEIPFAFGSALPKLSFRWGLNNAEVVNLENIYKESSIHQSGGNNFAMRVLALRPGQVTITLEVWSSATSDGTKTQLSGLLFKDEVPLQVFGDLQLIKPPVNADTILITPNTNLLLKSRRDSFARVSYKVIPNDSKSSQIKMEDKNLLVSGTQTGDEIIRVSAVDDYGLEQIKTIDVRVRNLAYIMVSADSENAVSFLPYGWTTTFKVSFHDNIGTEFHAANAQLKFRPSRFDKIHVNEGVDNKTLIIRALESGQTVLKVWDASNPQVVDYIHVVVKPAIEPFGVNVVEGDVICFKSPLVPNEGEVGGFWRSETNNIIIQPNSGIAVASRVGSDIIHFSISERKVTKAEVNIQPITGINIDTSVQYFVTNSPRSVHNIPVLLEGQRDSLNYLLGRNCSCWQEWLPNIIPPFACRIAFGTLKPVDVLLDDLFEVSPSFDYKSGDYSCQIKPLNKYSAERISVMDALILLKVETRNSLITKTAQLEFFPDVFVETKKVVLSSTKSIATLVIKANPKVIKFLEVTPTDPSVVLVGKPITEDEHPNVLNYAISLKKCPNIKDALNHAIIIKCDITNQEITIKVESCLEEDSEESRPWMDYLKNVMILLGTLIAWYIGYKVLLGPRFVDVRNQSQPPPVTPVTTQVRPHLWTVDNSFAGVTTPSPHRSVSFHQNSSGRTNYPFSEYLQPPS